MIYGINDFGIKVVAGPGSQAFCPHCGEKLMPKCGSINIWHWSHKFFTDCDNWHEPETQWHFDWKREFPKNQTEVIIIKNGDTHRADAVTKKGIILEFQNSPISAEEINNREAFYGKMYWILNAEEFKAHVIWCDRSGRSLGYSLYLNCERLRGIAFNFKWKNFRKSWFTARMPVFLDFNNGNLLLVKSFKASGCGWGTGKIIHKSSILKLATADY